MHKRRDHRRDKLIGRDQHPLDDDRIGRNRKGDGARDPGEDHAADPSHQRRQAESYHDHANHRRGRHSAQNQPAEGKSQSDHAGAAEGDGSNEPEPDRVYSGGDQERTPHDPLADREIDHARRFVNEHEGERDQRVNGAGQGAVDQ